MYVILQYIYIQMRESTYINTYKNIYRKYMNKYMYTILAAYINASRIHICGEQIIHTYIQIMNTYIRTNHTELNSYRQAHQT